MGAYAATPTNQCSTAGLLQRTLLQVLQTPSETNQACRMSRQSQQNPSGTMAVRMGAVSTDPVVTY